MGSGQSLHENKSNVNLLTFLLQCVVHTHFTSHPWFQLVASPDVGDSCLLQKWMSSYSDTDTDKAIQPCALWMHKEFNLCHVSKNPIYLKIGSSFSCCWVSFPAHTGTLTHIVGDTPVSDTLKHPFLILFDMCAIISHPSYKTWDEEEPI